MKKRIGKQTVCFENPPSVKSYYAIVSKKESEGPLGEYFENVQPDPMFGEESWEQGESKFLKTAMQEVIKKSGLTEKDIDYIFAGDLINQCFSSHFAARDIDTPFFGIYGACSTMAQTLIMGALAVDSGAADIAAAVTSSHFCTAERQFRLPLEYGSQRSPSAQWTATASGAVILGKSGKVKIKRLCPGKIIDLGVKDMANMGAAMAPAAANTLIEFFSDTKEIPQNYDYVFTGDLGTIGSELLCEIMKENGFNLAPNHRDCGVMIYDIKTQDVHAGGSGCGCSASVLCSYILKEMEKGNLKRVLFCATGALMSTTSSQQGESIPGICHLVELSL